MICRAIEIIDRQLDNDFEQRLKYYTNCRADFKRMETVLFRLIHMAMNLALSVHRLGNHSKAKGFMQVNKYVDRIYYFTREGQGQVFLLIHTFGLFEVFYQNLANRFYGYVETGILMLTNVRFTT